MGFSGEYSFFFLRREVRDAESALSWRMPGLSAFFMNLNIVSIQPILLGEGAVRCSFRKLPHGFLKNTSQLSFLNRAGAVPEPDSGISAATW